MKVITHDSGEVNIITDAFKIEVSENDKNIKIEVVDFDSERDHPWSTIQYQVIEKKREHSKDILTHTHEAINKWLNQM